MVWLMSDGELTRLEVNLPRTDGHLCYAPGRGRKGV
jgi:hypothetical protein